MMRRTSIVGLFCLACWVSGCDDSSGTNNPPLGNGGLGDGSARDSGATGGTAGNGGVDAAVGDAAMVKADTAASQSDAQAADTSAAGDAAPSVTEIVGYFSGDWGDMVLKQVGEEVWGSYTHDTGTIVGTFQNGVLVGWWSEVPSRLPTADAGDVEFRFYRAASGAITIDGRWRYGTQEAWREDWDIAQVTAPPPAPLVMRFDDATAFKRHP